MSAMLSSRYNTWRKQRGCLVHTPYVMYLSDSSSSLFLQNQVRKDLCNLSYNSIFRDSSAFQWIVQGKELKVKSLCI